MHEAGVGSGRQVLGQGGGRCWVREAGVGSGRQMLGHGGRCWVTEAGVVAQRQGQAALLGVVAAANNVEVILRQVQSFQ